MTPEELVPGLTHREFVAEAHRHRTEAEFRHSPFFVRWGSELEALLLTPRVLPAELPESPGRLPAARPLRVVQWNIEKGRRFEGVARRLLEDPWLREADLFTLNEVDDGTARGGNRDQAAELGRRLGATAVFQPCWIECTRGVGDDLAIPGEHRRGLQGVAILSRLPVLDARAVALPPCFDTFDFHEKRFGGRRGLVVRLDWCGRPLIVGTTHLEVRNTPACRARQFVRFRAGVECARAEWFGSGATACAEIPVVLTGDWNTGTFHRGSFVASVREFVRIVTRTRARLAAETAWPLSREPLFVDLAAAGYRVRGFNEPEPTVSQILGTVEDLGRLPAPVARGVSRVAQLDRREIHMRLDWIAARGLWPGGAPRTMSAGAMDGIRNSDHAIVAAELR